MKTNPSIQLRRQGPPAKVLCSGCRAVVVTLAPGERLALTGGEARSGTCGSCSRPWRVAVLQEGADVG